MASQVCQSVNKIMANLPQASSPFLHLFHITLIFPIFKIPPIILLPSPSRQVISRASPPSLSAGSFSYAPHCHLILEICPLVQKSPTSGNTSTFTLPRPLGILYVSIRSPLILLISKEYQCNFFSHRINRTIRTIL